MTATPAAERPVRIGIIGCGLMGSLHARTFASLPGVEVVALHNRTRDKAEALASEVGGTVYDSHEQLLEHDLDGVVVATPDHLHVEPATAVLASGRHLFLEKAISTSLEDAATIVAAGQARPDLAALVAYPLRFAPVYQAMQREVARTGVGKAVQAWSMRTHFLDPHQQVYDKYRDHYYATPSWYFDPEIGKGPIFSHASHDYDLLGWMCGEVESVFAIGDTYLLPPGSVADAFTVSLRFASGAIGQVSTPWVTRVDYDITGVATEQMTVMNNDGELRVKDATGPERRTSFSENDMWQPLATHFIDCIRHGQRPLVSLLDGMRAIAISEAALRSLSERREVAVDLAAVRAAEAGSSETEGSANHGA